MILRICYGSSQRVYCPLGRSGLVRSGNPLLDESSHRPRAVVMCSWLCRSISKLTHACGPKRPPACRPVPSLSRREGSVGRSSPGVSSWESKILFLKPPPMAVVVYLGRGQILSSAVPFRYSSSVSRIATIRILLSEMKNIATCPHSYTT